MSAIAALCRQSVHEMFATTCICPPNVESMDDLCCTCQEQYQAEAVTLDLLSDQDIDLVGPEFGYPCDHCGHLFHGINTGYCSAECFYAALDSTAIPF